MSNWDIGRGTKVDGAVLWRARVEGKSIKIIGRLEVEADQEEVR